jgi:hypothetical protein
MSLISFLKGGKDLSYQAYIVRMALAWLYTLIWCAGLMSTWMYWDSLPVYLKAFIVLLLIILTPTGSELILSYKTYKGNKKVSGTIV